jgi:protein TonB
MSPSAMILATVLHALAALAVWLIAKNPPRLPPTQDPVEIVFEQPPKPEPPKPSPKPEVKPPAPPLFGLPPPADITSDKPTQVPPKAQELAPNRPMETPGARSLEQTVPPPQQQAPPPTDSAFAAPKPALPPPQPDPRAKSLLFKPETPTPPAEARPPPRAFGLQQRPPAIAKGEESSSSPMVNPADVYNRARLADNYRWQIVRKLEGRRITGALPTPAAGIVVRVLLARDGRLLNVVVAQSSGFPDVDRGVLEAVRWGSPYEPLPADIKGNTASFDVPLVASHAYQ